MKREKVESVGGSEILDLEKSKDEAERFIVLIEKGGKKINQDENLFISKG